MPFPTLLYGRIAFSVSKTQGQDQPLSKNLQTLLLQLLIIDGQRGRLVKRNLADSFRTRFQYMAVEPLFTL